MRGRLEVGLSPNAPLPFPAESFDVVTALDVIEHIEDDVSALKDLHRVMRHSSLLLIAVPAFQFLWRPGELVLLDLRVRVGQHLPYRCQEELIAAKFRETTDWQKTTAFALPALYTSYVRINLAGREPQGTVMPGDEYRETLLRIERDLNLLTDPYIGHCRRCRGSADGGAWRRRAAGADARSCGQLAPQALHDEAAESLRRRGRGARTPLCTEHLPYLRGFAHCSGTFAFRPSPGRLGRRYELGGMVEVVRSGWRRRPPETFERASRFVSFEPSQCPKPRKRWL